MSDYRDPIFIGGLSGSGKTPLRIVLGAHPAISMTRRTYMWDRFYGRFGDLSHPPNLMRCLSAMTADASVRTLEPDADRIHREFLEDPPTYARLFGLFHQHYAERAGKRRWGDQLALVERFADPILATFPAARMIHLIRNPLDRVSSRGRRKRLKPGRVGWELAMWLYSARLAERNQRRYPNNYKVLRYETLAQRPHDVLRDVCAFLDEDYAASMQRALAEVRPDLQVAAAKRASLDDGGSRRSPLPAAFIDMYARREFPAFEYHSGSSRLSGRDRLSFLLVDWPVNRLAMAVWRIATSSGLPVRRIGGQ